MSYLMKRMKQEFNLSIDMSAFHRRKIFLPTFYLTGFNTQQSYNYIVFCWAGPDKMQCNESVP